MRSAILTPVPWLLCALVAGCGSQADLPPDWRDRQPAAPVPDGSAALPPTTLGTAFVLTASTIDASVPAVAEFCWGDGTDLDRRVELIDRGSLVLRSSGFQLALLGLEVHAVHNAAELELSASAPVTGLVLASEPDNLEVVFRVFLSLKATEGGRQQVVTSVEPVELRLRVRRDQDRVQVSIDAARDAAHWVVGTHEVRGGPLSFDLQGELAPP